MARQRDSRTSNAPDTSAQAIDNAVRYGNWANALYLSERLAQRTRQPADIERFRSVTLDAVKAQLRQGRDRDAGSMVDQALGWHARVAQQPPVEWITNLMSAFAAAGIGKRAMELAQRIAKPWPDSMMHQIIDMALAKGPAGRTDLEEPLRASFDAVLLAFEQFHQGDDEAATATLQTIGLQSPFTDWKLLIRGLIAWFKNDDNRARDNWSRLNAERLPARLIAGLRDAIDPDYRAAQEPAMVAELQQRSEALSGHPLVVGLRTIRQEIHGGKGLASCFQTTAQVVSQLKTTAPEQIPRLARVLYAAVLHQGGPDDVDRYRRVFGAPADDLGLDRLRALGYQAGGQWEEANHHWHRYDLAISTSKAFTDEERSRARSLLWERMAKNLQEAALEDEDDFDDPFAFLREPRKTRNPSKKPTPEQTIEGCLQRAAELAPDRLGPQAAMVEHLVRVGDSAKAEQAGRALLERFPQHLPTLKLLAISSMMREDAAAAIELASRAIKLNPLDRDLQSLTADAHLLAGRQAALAGDLEAARNAFRTALRFGSGIEDPAVLACWAVAEAKAGNTTEANELRARMAAHPHLRAMDVFWTLTETIRLKAKPAEKKAAEKAFAELLAGPPQAETVTALAAVLSNLSERPINYHGYKTHHKKMVDYVTKAVRIPGGYHDEQRQAICEALIDLKLSKALTAHASQAIKESRENPWFHFYLIEAEYLLPPNRRRNNYRLLETFTQAERLARASNDPRAKELLDLLADRRREMQIIDPEMMFDLLFGRGDPNAR